MADKVRDTLRQIYGGVVKEPVPEDMRALLERLN